MSRVVARTIAATALATACLLPASLASAQQTSGADVRCESAAQDVTEFGGAYVEDRVLHLWLTEPDASTAEAVIASLRKRCPPHDDIAIEAADYSYAQLTEWGRQAVAVSGVTMTGVDVRANRLTVGVTDLDRDGPAVTAALAESGIPADAVVLQEAGPFRTLPVIPDNSRLLWVGGALAIVVAGGGAAVLAVARRSRVTRS